MVAWGNNEYSETSIPAGLTGVIGIAAGYYHTVAISKLQVTTTASNGGSISPSSFVKNGDNVRVTYQANPGYYLDSIFINGVYNMVASRDSINGYTFSNINSFQNIRVVFTPLIITTIADTTKGTITPTTQLFTNNFRVTYQPKTNYFIYQIYINDSLKQISPQIDSATGYTFNNILKKQKIEVVFKSINDAIIKSTNRAIYKTGDTLIITGRNIKALQLKADFDRIVVTNFISKISLNATDTNYAYKIPDSFKNKVYQVYGIGYNNTLSNLRLMRVYNFNTDSFGVVAWGRNVEGQTSIPAGLTGVIGIAGGGYHTVALKSDGTVVAWGYNNYGQTTIPAGLTGVIGIAAGLDHTVAIYKLQVSTTASNGGSISPSTFVKRGDNVRVTYQASPGYYLDSIFINGVYHIAASRDSINGYTFTNINSNKTIRVVYSQISSNSVPDAPSIDSVIAGNAAAIVYFKAPF
ncbi:MAG: hypothetical protein ORN58_01200, partial [Sediminibacterium sp.]|nr:hypothetical protein [Sediminibacterium sp.]